MGITALYAASTGMRALDTKLDVTANNLANINTHGFKRSRVNFEDLLYQVRREPGLLNKDEQPIPHGIQVGLGVKVSGTQIDFSPGGVDPTDGQLDLLIDGPGFFQVQTVQDGVPITAYTRNGAFSRNAAGQIVLSNSEGAILEPELSIPEEATSVSVSPNGQVSVRTQGSNESSVIGDIQLARFVNPEGLKQIGQNLYAATNASGEATVGTANTDGFGAIAQGQLEQSNVDPVRELIDLIQTQRGYELNSQSIQSADQALRTVTNLRRF
jgi:flagellar basal-body rod protein FlgG